MAAKKVKKKIAAKWQAMADELVVESIVRAALKFSGPHEGYSIVQELASKRLMEIAKAESPALVEKVLGERDRCLEGFSRLMEAVTTGGK
jgi:hypothetical protein